MIKRLILSTLSLLLALTIKAQIGEHRNQFSVGISGGYVLNKIGFIPTVNQTFHTGYTGGVAFRYTAEKYFTTLCAVQIEVNMAQLGWKEDIKTYFETEVVNPETEQTEEYQRNINYVQVPFLAHLSWGKEKNGVCGFINLGPQLGILINESTKKNYDKPFTIENFPNEYSSTTGRVNQIVAQENMPVENKFDYGITFGAGVEAHIKNIGRFALEGRYYYGLGNLYGDSKRDFFGASHNNTIFIKLAYFHDL